MLILSRGRVKKYDICHLNSDPPPHFWKADQNFFKKFTCHFGWEILPLFVPNLHPNHL